MKLSNKIIILSGIILITLFLRLYQLGTIPPALTWDEAAWGYNSYSLSLDARDEFGQFLPYKYLESFGDFKPPLYAYIGIMPIKIWGLTEFAVRFPSALFGALTVFLTYFLVREIFYNSSKKEYYAIFSSLLLSVSPWHINLSRAAFEANVSQFFIVLGLFLFLIALRKNMWILSLSAASLALSFYTFNTARVFVPIIVLILALFFVKKLWNFKKQTFIAGIVGFIMLVPIIGFLFSPQAALRFQEVNIFSDPKVVEISNQEIENDNNSTLSKLLHNRRVKYATSFISHYLDHFNPSFLFIKGDGNPKFSTQDVGQLYLWSLPFFVVGSLLLFRKREGNWWIVPVWLLTAIIPAATARETPHALRIETSLPMFQILASYGFINSVYYLKQSIKKSFLFKSVFTLLLILLLLNVSYFVYGYYTHYAREYSGEWQYGYREAFEYTEQNKEKYDEIYFTDKLGRPYIYYLFYAGVSPEEFRSNHHAERDPFGFVTVRRVGKYNFSDYLEIAENEKNILYVNDELNVPEDANILKEINKLNGEKSLIIYTK